MCRVGDTVRIVKPRGTCCGVGSCGTVGTVQKMYHSSPFAKHREVVLELDTGDIVHTSQVERVQKEES